ncbi:MAG: hypothetical protein V4467_00765 [Patescibacteria group bacterium]
MEPIHWIIVDTGLTCTAILFIYETKESYLHWCLVSFLDFWIGAHLVGTAALGVTMGNSIIPSVAFLFSVLFFVNAKRDFEKALKFPRE